MFRACELKDQTYKKTRTLHFSEKHKKHIKIYAFTRRVSKLKYASFTLTLRQPYAAEIAALRSLVWVHADGVVLCERGCFCLLRIF